jgi:hypothetical protein
MYFEIFCELTHLYCAIIKQEVGLLLWTYAHSCKQDRLTYTSLVLIALCNIYRVRQKDLPHFKRQLQTNKERYGKNTLICEQQI